MKAEKPQPSKQKISKKKLVKNWLLSHRTITARQASNMFGADRLADIVFRLRGEGMRIESPLQDGQDRFLNDVHFSKYRWLGEIPKIKFDHISHTNGKTKIYTFIHNYPMQLREKLKHINNYLKKKIKTKVKRVMKLQNREQVLAETSGGTRLFMIKFVEKN